MYIRENTLQGYSKDINIHQFAVIENRTIHQIKVETDRLTKERRDEL